jgi:hypothetical protein
MTVNTEKKRKTWIESWGDHYLPFTSHGEEILSLKMLHAGLTWRENERRCGGLPYCDGRKCGFAFEVLTGTMA